MVEDWDGVRLEGMRIVMGSIGIGVGWDGRGL